jgi:hypothetical protein
VSPASDTTRCGRALLVRKSSPDENAGFPQLYIRDPDRHLIETNAERHIDPCTED